MIDDDLSDDWKRFADANKTDLALGIVIPLVQLLMVIILLMSCMSFEKCVIPCCSMSGQSKICTMYINP